MPSTTAANNASKPSSAAVAYSNRSSIAEMASTGAGAGGSANPNGSIAAIIRGSARGSSRSVIAGEPSRPGSTGEPMVTPPCSAPAGRA